MGEILTCTLSTSLYAYRLLGHIIIVMGTTLAPEKPLRLLLETHVERIWLVDDQLNAQLRRHASSVSQLLKVNIFFPSLRMDGVDTLLPWSSE